MYQIYAHDAYVTVQSTVVCHYVHFWHADKVQKCCSPPRLRDANIIKCTFVLTRAPNLPRVNADVYSTYASHIIQMSIYSDSSTVAGMLLGIMEIYSIGNRLKSSPAARNGTPT